MKIFFKTVSNEECLFDFIMEFLQKMNNKIIIEEFLNKNINKFPFNLEIFESNKNLIDKNFIFKQFNFKFLWYKDKNLVGLMANYIPKELETLYLSVHYDLDKKKFINNDKKLYEYTDWYNLGDWAEMNSNRFKSMSEIEFLKHQPYSNIFNALDNEKKDYLLTFFKKELDIENVLYNNSSSKYDTLNISLITNHETENKILNILKEIKINKIKSYLKILEV